MYIPACVFVYVLKAWDLLKIVDIVVAKGGAATFWDFYQVWGEKAFEVLDAAVALGVVKWKRVDKPGRRVVYVLGRRGRVLYEELLAHWGMAPPGGLGPRNRSHKSIGGKSSSSPTVKYR